MKMNPLHRGSFGVQMSRPGLYVLDLIDCTDGTLARGILTDEDLEVLIDALVSLRSQRAQYVSEEEIASLAHVRGHIVARWLDAKKIPFIRQGGRRLVRRVDLLLFLVRRNAERPRSVNGT